MKSRQSVRMGSVILGLAIVGGALGVAGAGATAKGPHLVVRPAAGLHNHEVVRVEGVGFKPGDTVFLVECLLTAKGQAGCQVNGIPPSVTIRKSGVLPWTKFTVTTGKIGNGTCGTTVKNLGSCAVSAGNANGKDSAQARIVFARPTK